MSPAAARPSARYRSVIVISILVFLLLGFVALGRLPVDSPPARDAPYLNVRLSAPGLTAPIIEEMLTLPLERVLAGIPGVASMNSISTSGGATIDLRLIHRGETSDVQREVMARLERNKAAWPASVDPPLVTWVDQSSAIMEFRLISTIHDPLVLRDWAEAEFARRLRELPGVAAVEISGGTVREILVMPDQRRLAGYGLSFEDLLQSIRKNPEAHSHAGATPVKPRSRREPLLSGSLAAVAAIPVILPSGESVRLSEVARLMQHQSPTSPSGPTEAAGTVRITVHKQAQAALSEVLAQIRSHVDWMRANQLIPESIKVHSQSERFDEARETLKRMAYAFLIGFILVLSTARLLWRRGRRTLILGAITLASIQGVFIIMALSGLTLNVMTLGGLVLATGFLGGSVMLWFEGAARSAQSPAQGRHPVMVAAALPGAALVTAGFLGGESTVIFRELVAAFGGAWLLAVLLAWWLVPVFDEPWRGEKVPGNTAAYRAILRLRDSYNGLLPDMPHRAAPWLVVALVMTVIAISVLMAKFREAPAPEMLPNQEILLRLQGPDGAGLLAFAEDVTQRLSTLRGLLPATHSAQLVQEEPTLHMDEARASTLGVEMAAVGKALAIARAGIPAGYFRDADHRYHVRMRLPPEETTSVATGKILILGELEHRPAVHLRDVATVELATVPAQIRHHQGKPEIEISARIVDEFPADQVMRDVRALIGQMSLPSGYHLYFGQGADMEKRSPGLLLPGVAVLLILLVATWLCHSLRLGLLITSIATVSPVITGAVLAALGMPMTPLAWIGGIMLLGISAGHVAALVACCEARPQNLSGWQRLRQGLRYQFVPLVAMVTTAILGMLSLIWVNGSASVLSTLVIFLATGLFFSLLATLLLTPLLYWLVPGKEQTNLA